MESAMDQQFRLRWNNHPDNMTDVLVSLYHKQQLCDVTLACKGELIRAHQTVLTACSPFFEEMLLNINHPHPIIILADINLGELKAVLEFMYKGEVNVSQNLLSVFLKTAEVLRVKGLTDNNLLNDKERRAGGGAAAGELNRRSHSPAPHEKRKRKSSNCDTNSNSDSRHNDSQATSNYKSTHLPKSQSERDVGSPDDIMPPQLVKQEPQQGSPQHIDSYHSMSEALQTGGSLSVHQDDLLSSHGLDHNEETKPPMPPLDPTDTIDEMHTTVPTTHLAYNDMFEQSVSNSLLWKCRSCAKEVTNRWHHFHSHTPQRSICPYCPATYSRIDTLRSHLRSKHIFMKHLHL
ncbi:sex determination protein fruitless isoform X3 [Atheta coriaria]|uniref:sex determination protein fruitless isoform X3 n=1 Tax=Dalotia coriaria TaxID=877792 RepID=UPI0031F37F8B